MRKSLPVHIPLASLSRNNDIFAISAGSENRPSGVRDLKKSRR
jgi:hypothetical protein